MHPLSIVCGKSTGYILYGDMDKTGSENVQYDKKAKKEILEELCINLIPEKASQKFGIKGNTVAQFELGRSNPVNSVISLICREFNVVEMALSDSEPYALAYSWNEPPMPMNSFAK